MEVRTVDPADTALCRHLGAIVVRAYTTLPGHVDEPDYEAELVDVAGRAALPDTEVLAAVDADDVALGCVTYVAASTSPMAERLTDGEAAVRMLGVDPTAQGRGVGRTLIVACIDQARSAQRSSVVLHTTPWMTAAHCLYEQVGFARDPGLDWAPAPDVPLLGYRLIL